MLSPCRFSSSISCMSFPLNIGRHLLFAESEPALTSIRGGGFFVRHYGDFCTGADTLDGVAIFLTVSGLIAVGAAVTRGRLPQQRGCGPVYRGSSMLRPSPLPQNESYPSVR